MYCGEGNPHPVIAGLGCLLVVVSVGACRPEEQAEGGPPNILVLLTDDQGVDQFAAYGEHPNPPPTPRMDGLAAEGVLFRNAWAYPSCSPSRAALLTGRLGRRTGIGDALQYNQGRQVPLPEVSLPEVLASAPTPYSTAAVGKWHLSAYNSPHGVNHPNQFGFESFAGSVANLYDYDVEDGRAHSYYHWERVVDGAIDKVDEYATTVTVDDALARMREMPEPWFLYVAFNAPHTPLDPPPPELHTQGDVRPSSIESRRYRAVLEALDTEIGRMLDTMDPELRERTTIVLAGDNGTPTDAILEPWDPNRSKLTPYEGGVNVPLVIAGASVPEGGQESGALVHLMDVFSTVLELAGTPPPAGVTLDSESLVPFLEDPEAPGRDVLYTERFVPSGAPPYDIDWRISRDERFKVVHRATADEIGVFDLQGRSDEGDVLDLSSLSAAEQEQVQALLDTQRVHWRSIRGPDPGGG